MAADTIYVESGSAFADVAIPLVALALALGTFIIERFISRNQEKKNNRINWFLSIIVQPQLEEINTVYQDLLDKLKKDITELNTTRLTGDKRQLYEALRVKNFYIKSNHQVNFVPFISMIESYDVKLSIVVKDILREIDDIYSLELARATIGERNEDNDQTIEVKFYSNRSKLYRALYRDLHS
ncbi:MAG: hypothetical protein QNK23_10500 [Crocinitomicaceae bacterium]|nr:hypothetical protein [Crocinitomicaceae bacterium]